jgi:hypothetical protein
MILPVKQTKTLPENFQAGALRQDSVQLYTVALLLATETIKDRQMVHAVSVYILPQTVLTKDVGWRLTES